jgi:parvulin-like peptidyl-prolyl isomerase
MSDRVVSGETERDGTPASPDSGKNVRITTSPNQRGGGTSPMPPSSTSPSASEPGGTAAPAPDAVRSPGSIESDVLTVNNDAITTRDVLRRIRPELERLAQVRDQWTFPAAAQQSTQIGVLELVRELLLYQHLSANIAEAQSAAIEKSIDKAIDSQVSHQFSGSRIRWEKYLSERGFTADEWRRELRRGILVQDYLRTTFRPKVIITRNDLWEYYQSRRSEFQSPARIHLCMIEIDADAFLPSGVHWAQADEKQRQQAGLEAQARLKEVQWRLASNEDFLKVACELSTSITGRVNGGDIGWISQGSFKIKEIEDSAFALAVDQVSPPIVVERKHYLVKVTEAEAVRNVPFSDAQSLIQPDLENNIYNELINNHVKELSSKARIGPIEPFARAVMARLPDYDELKKSRDSTTRQKAE